MDQLERLESKLDRIVDMISGIKETTATHTAQGEDHSRRITEMEVRVEKLKDADGKLKGALALTVFLAGAMETVRHFLGGKP